MKRRRFVLVLIMLYEAYKWMTKDASHADLLILYAIILIEVMFPVGWLALKKLRLRKTFELRLVEAGPHPGSPYMAVDVQVAVHHTTDVQRFNMRFVTKGSYGRFV